MKCNRKIKECIFRQVFLLFVLCIIAISLIGTVSAQTSNSFVKELKKVDVFHPPTDNSQMPFYNEWHYFNIIDEKQHISIICTFKLNGFSSNSEILLRYNVKGNSNAYLQAYPIGIAKYSSKTPDVQIANSTVRLTPEGYSVHVVSDDGSKVLDALFKPEAEPSPEYNATIFGGIINWIVASPKMEVNGKLTADGKKYTLKNAKGYHDHNWGYWNWENLGWDWGQNTQTKNELNGNDIGKYSLNFGNITDASSTQSFKSVLNIWKNREIVATFTNKDMQVKHSNFDKNITIPLYQGAVLPKGSFPLPINTDISVSSCSRDYLNIKFTADPINCAPLPLSVLTIDENGKPQIKYRIIWEMIGIYQVNGEIKGKQVSYTSDGFMEYVSGNAILPNIQP